MPDAPRRVPHFWPPWASAVFLPLPSRAFFLFFCPLVVVIGLLRSGLCRFRFLLPCASRLFWRSSVLRAPSPFCPPPSPCVDFSLLASFSRAVVTSFLVLLWPAVSWTSRDRAASLLRALVLLTPPLGFGPPPRSADTCLAFMPGRSSLELQGAWSPGGPRLRALLHRLRPRPAPAWRPRPRQNYFLASFLLVAYLVHTYRPATPASR